MVPKNNRKTFYRISVNILVGWGRDGGYSWGTFNVMFLIPGLDFLLPPKTFQNSNGKK